MLLIYSICNSFISIARQSLKFIVVVYFFLERKYLNKCKGRIFTSSYYQVEIFVA